MPRILMGEALPFAAPIRVGSHHYARAFMAAGHQVFWLGDMHHVVAAVRGCLGSARHDAPWHALRSGPDTIGPGSVSYHPVTLLPFRDRLILRQSWVLRASARLIVPGLPRVLRKAGFARPDLLWLSQTPHALHLARSIPCGRLVYRMSDRYTEFDGVPDILAGAEQEIIARADVVFVTARGLMDAVPPAHQAKVTYLPNGVDAAHFSARRMDEPADLAPLPRPRAVYMGSIGPWVDLSLVAAIADAVPEVSIVLVGPAATDLRELGDARNVSILGPRHYDQLPAYLAHCDVGLIPFKRSPLTEAVNPVKLFEYLASGLPVVATRLGELVATEAPVLFADGAAEFATALKRAVADGRDRPDFAAFARANTWHARYETVKSLCLTPGDAP